MPTRLGVSLGANSRVGAGGGTPTLVERNIANRGMLYTGRATPPAGKTRLKHRIAYTIWAAADEIALVYANKYLLTGSGEAAGSNDIVIRKAALELDGAATQVTFGGEDGLTVAAGDLDIVSDWIPLSVTPGDTLWCRAEYDVVQATNSYVIGTAYRTSFLPNPESNWIYDPANEVDDIISSGSMTAPTGATATNSAYHPVLLIGRVASGQEAVIGIGDSISAGLRDEFRPDDLGGGFISRAAYAAMLPYCSSALSGQTASAFNAAHTFFDSVAKYHTLAVSGMATNDLVAGATDTTTLARLKSLWATANTNLAGGKKVYQSLVIPRLSSSTNKTTSLAGQTVETGFTDGSYRDLLNAAIIANVGSDSLTDYIDVSTPVEDPTDHTKWAVPEYTGTLSAAMTGTATTASLSDTVPVFTALVFDPENASGQVGPTSNFIARTVTGSGPYTANTLGASTVGVAQDSGNAYASTLTYDGIHPVNAGNELMAAPVEAKLTA